MGAPQQAQADRSPTVQATDCETFDVLIVGAGISGIGSAWYLQRDCPEKTFVLLECKDSFGGTWHTHRYPGVRSDSDLYTFGFSFKPWVEEPIATADRINAYLQGVLDENDLQRHIRYRHRVLEARWSDEDALWTLEVRHEGSGAVRRFKGCFLWMCQGYYRHEEGYTPQWQGMADFKGRIVHPQTWPEDLDHGGKRVAIIGSGATAATLLPALAEKAGHITMIQRSPTFFYPGSNADPLADELRALEIDENWIHAIVRKRRLAEQKERVYRSQREPETVAEAMIAAAREHLGPDVDVEKHFTPRYRPWQQRVAFVPDGDFFAPFRSGRASIETDEIECFTAEGLKLKSGKDIEADIIVTATGFNLCVMGDIAFQVNGEPLRFSDTVTYQGMMFTAVPNLVSVFGYFRAAWTLRVEMVAEFVCRLLQHMDAVAARKVTVKIPAPYDKLPPLSWSDPENFNPGYLVRGMHLLPKRLDCPDWQHTQDYWSECERFTLIDLTGDVFVYE